MHVLRGFSLVVIENGIGAGSRPARTEQYIRAELAWPDGNNPQNCFLGQPDIRFCFLGILFRKIAKLSEMTGW